MPESGSETAGGTAAAREIIACAQRSLTASARAEVHQEMRFPHGEWPRPRGLGGRVLRLAGRLVKLLARLWWTRATRRLEAHRGLQFGHLVGEGIVEPARGRYMIDYGSYAELHTEGQTYGGRSGLPLQRLRSRPESGQVGNVLWLLRLPTGATDANLEGSDTLHGAVCQRLAATVDLARASAASEHGLAAPQEDRFEQLRALPVMVWIDGQYVRRVRFEQAGPPSRSLSLDLWEFGISVGELDWSRLPTFRSPGYEQEPRPWYRRARANSGTVELAGTSDRSGDRR